MSKSILELNHTEAMDFLLKSDQYHNFELPEYFVFDKVLKFVRERIGDKDLDECAQSSPEKVDDLNFEMLTNKDGRYAVRPLTLANPYLYYFLVRELCNEVGWDAALDCFAKYKVPNITSCALPIVKEEGEKESFNHSISILNWWNTFEQQSIELSLQYRYMFVTDITNCYGTINPEAISSAMAFRGTKHQTDKYNDMAVRIRRIVGALQCGRNIGIPQGSVAFDFLGEFVLGYSDLLLHERLEKMKQKNKDFEDYKILRYRDDYRIFSNSKDALVEISYILQQVLESLGLRLNSAKTKISDNIVTDAIKPDKLWIVRNTAGMREKRTNIYSVQKHLLYILQFGREFPNAGQIRVLLSDLDKSIRRWIKKKTKEEVVVPLAEGIELCCDANSEDGKKALKENPEAKRRTVIPEMPGNIKAMAAIATQIAIENTQAVQHALVIISRMVDTMKVYDDKCAIRNLVADKLAARPNSDYDKIWIQNMTYCQDKADSKHRYSDVRLCRLVMGDKATLWDISWLNPELTRGFPQATVCDKAILRKVTPVITFRETRAYYEN